MSKQIKLIFILFLLLSFTWSQAQYIAAFAIIKDKDGFVNVRENNNVKSKIVGKIFENQVFEDLDVLENEKNEWVSITYGISKQKASSANKTEDQAYGYIHKSRIEYLSNLPKLKMKIISENNAEFKNDDLVITIKTGKFIPKQHQIKRQDGFVSKIDDQYPWGIDGIIPEKLIEIKSIKIFNKNETYTIPTNNLIGMYSPNFENTQIFIGSDKTIFIAMSNGDAAGAYNVVWTIKNNHVKDQFVFRDF
ncbi:SH3 domain-containing protein [Flavobacterium sp. MMS24-S5]|uniref:SH3 domain-containing protein n=1 Tax=Flavobacterium sp. MMS24-S5 TaxID=3416605 RepID=UPI003D003FC6